MEGLVMAGQLLLGLGLLVFIHELGHFLAARAFGIRVEKFYIFFDFGGFKLYSKKIGDTEYGIGWFPLGGYVKISGMIDESMDKSQMNSEPEPWEFRSKPSWQRFIVMMAGVVMNVVLGVLIFAFVLLYYRVSYLPPENVDDGIYAYEMAKETGLQTGDKITAINGKKAMRYIELNSFKVLFGAELTVERDGKTILIDLPDELFQKIKNEKNRFIVFDNYTFSVDSVFPETPAAEGRLEKGDRVIAINETPIKVFGRFRETLAEHAGKEIELSLLRGSDTVLTGLTVNSEGLIGMLVLRDNPYEIVKYTVASAFYYGAKDGFEAIYYNAIGLGKIATGKVNASESLQSPIGIARIYGGVWEWNKFWYLTGLISFILAFMNLLPIPALDGGHVVFIIIEVIQGKPVSDKFLEKAQVVGMVLLLALMTFAFGNDIYKWIFK